MDNTFLDYICSMLSDIKYDFFVTTKKINLSIDFYISMFEKFEQIRQWSGRGKSNPHHSLGKAVF